MGIDILPVLAEALDDTTPTQTPNYVFDTEETGPTHKVRMWQANEIVAMLICDVAHREFGDRRRHGDNISIKLIGSRPDLVPKFKKDVLSWYAENKGKTMSERMIKQLSDRQHINRYNAIIWLSAKKDKAGREALLKRFQRIPDAQPAGNRHGELESELAMCALALGQIGDSRDLDIVRKICKYFSEKVEMSTPQEYSFSAGMVFEAYRGLALLGKKEEAMKELHRLYDDYSTSMGTVAADNFRDKLEQAKNWGKEGTAEETQFPPNSDGSGDERRKFPHRRVEPQ